MLRLPHVVLTVFLKNVLYKQNRINISMRMLILTLPFIFLSSCSPTQCPLSSFPKEDKERYNESEPTLQSAEDAMKTKFDENSFNR